MNMPLPPPLLVTDDDVLLAEVLRLAAAAGVVPQVVADEGAALQLWSRALMDAPVYPDSACGATVRGAAAAIAAVLRPSARVASRSSL